MTETKKDTAFDKWLIWNSTRSNNPASPDIVDVWDGAIQTAAYYMVNEIILSLNESVPPDVWIKMRKKMMTDLGVEL